MTKVIFCVVVVFVVLIFIGIWTDERACHVKAKSFDEHEFYVFGGCMVKHKDRWLPLDNIRGEDLD
jgi:hypothetical protein